MHANTPLSRVFVATALGLALAACGGAETSSGPGPVPPSERFEAGPFEVEPGSELVMCTYVRGANQVDADVTSFQTEQSDGGHHLIVYALDHAVDLPPSPCSQGGQPGWAQLVVSQDQEDEQAFPPGVGFHVRAHQQYVMETHYINTTPEPLTVGSAFSERFAAAGEVTDRAAAYFFGTLNIDVPPGSTSSASVACSPPEAMTLRTMFGHEHRHGTGVQVDLLAGGNEAERVYETDRWEEPPIDSFAGGRDVGPADTIRVSCDWKNDGTEPLRYPHEMCFAIGYHWPAEAGVFCVSGGRNEACDCRYQGKDDPGPGGGRVEVKLRRELEIAGAKGALDAGAPLYCALYRAEDWAAVVPKGGAQPWYFRDAIDVPLATTSDVASFAIEDVTPGEYAVTCMMDTIGGGFVVGSGDVVNLGGPMITVARGETVQVDATLDFAVP